MSSALQVQPEGLGLFFTQPELISRLCSSLHYTPSALSEQKIDDSRGDSIGVTRPS